MNRFVRLLVTTSSVLALTTLAGCQHEFDPKVYHFPAQLFAAGLKEYNERHWDNAEAAFDQLTKAVSARDPLLPIAYYYLGAAQDKDGEHLLAAQSFNRVAESFPEDSLAPQALMSSGNAYSELWRRPELDPEYGQQADTVFTRLVALYPESPLVPAAKAKLAYLDNMFAQKDYDIGYHYLRRGAYDSAIIYFKDVIRLHPDAPITRKAYLSLHRAYSDIRYADDAHDVCQTILKIYPNDREVVSTCGSVSSAAASTPHT